MFTEFLFEYQFFNVFPLNILCVFFILTLEKEGARWLKTHNLFWKALFLLSICTTSQNN